MFIFEKMVLVEAHFQQMFCATGWQLSESRTFAGSV